MQRALGLDFGTTNTAIAVADPTVRLARFAADAGSPNGAAARAPLADEDLGDTFRSILFFDPEYPDNQGRAQAFAGPSAIGRYLGRTRDGRLIQSIKSHLASGLVEKTNIFGRTYLIEDLVALLIGRVCFSAQQDLGELGSRVVCGRPVRFAQAEQPEDEARAIGRLTRALTHCGFSEVELEYEPVAAAHEYESRLDHDELVLIGDFGGGTSDFCLIRVGAKARTREDRHADILSTSGVARAGDDFDAALVSALVAPALGAGSRYRLPFGGGRTMEIPPWIYSRMRRWHHLSFLRARDTMHTLEELRKQAIEPEKIEALLHLIQADLGFTLYRSIERAKVEVCGTHKSVFSFIDEPILIERPFLLTDFESWIGAELDAIERAVQQVLEASGVGTSDVDRVFLTGGSSLVPAVRALFERQFGAAKLSGGRELTSVALGLARRALR